VRAAGAADAVHGVGRVSAVRLATELRTLQVVRLAMRDQHSWCSCGTVVLWFPVMLDVSCPMCNLKRKAVPSLSNVPLSFISLCQLHRHCHKHNTGCCSTAPFILYPYTRRVNKINHHELLAASAFTFVLTAWRYSRCCLARQTLHACFRPSAGSRCAQNSFRGLICDQGSRLMIAMLDRGRQHSSRLRCRSQMQPRACRGLASAMQLHGGNPSVHLRNHNTSVPLPNGHCECRPELTHSPPSRRSTACALFAGGVRHPAALPSTAARFAMRTACTSS